MKPQTRFFKNVINVFAIAALLVSGFFVANSAGAATTINVYNLQPSWTAAGGGGVWSSYQGPNDDYAYNSPGVTAVYDGREAAPIYAGVTADPISSNYEDQGLFAFKPGDVPIGTFATQPLTYDFVNQSGANPVWVYIELNKGIAGDIMYQYVPTTNPATWHTEDAATGTHWQAWTDTTSGITTGPMLSLADIAALDGTKTVSRVYLTEGMGNSYNVSAGVGTVAWVDKVTIGDVIYDFVLIPACSGTSSFDSFTTGTVNGQDGWSVTGPYDQAVVNNNYGYPSFGCKSFRISDAVTSGSFGDQTFSPSNINEAGETSATSGGMSGGTRQNRFEAQFDFASTQSAQQPGLFISISPDRGDGSRMSYLGFSDELTGIDVIFYDVQGENAGFQAANFVPTTVAAGLSRATAHTAKFVIDYVDGSSNDIVKIYIDGILVHTGTTWENYYRFDTEASAEQTTRTTDSLLIRAGGTPVPATSGSGFLFDNFSLSSGPTPPGPAFIDTNANHVLDLGEISYPTIQAAVDAATAGDTIQVTAGTYPEHVAVNKSLTINGANWAVAGNGAREAESIVDGTDTGTPFAITANDVTINGFKVENGSNGGLYSGIWSQTGTQNYKIINNIITQNGFGVWAQCGGNCLIQTNLFDGNNKPNSPGSGDISADSTTGLTINDNEFKNDTAGNPILLQAVAAGAHSNIIVSNNTFHDNVFSNIYALGIDGGTFNNNTITPASDATGISFSGADANITVTMNIITGSARGIRVEDAGYGLGANSAITINRNSLTGNSEYGVGNITEETELVNATCNWWGSISGPGSVGPGTGDKVTSNVTFLPWLTTANLDGPCNGPLIGPPTDKDECKDDGWKTFNNPSFENQGECVSFVEPQPQGGGGGGGGGDGSHPAPPFTPPGPPFTPPGQVLGTITFGNGTLVKTADNPTVYMVVNGKLRPFTTAAIFLARGLKFSDILIIGSDLVTAENLGRHMGYPDGTLIRGTGPTVYRVSGDAKQGITSMAAFTRMNLSLRNIVRVSDADLNTYDDGGIAQ